ncbi:lysine N(6)-hydroxylase/L-ornithine N(5)-oxygenase family protein [Nocardioides marmotae]|uniref:lysine N(6)-hydroxylase/L-ornithine N(5)-oxygenase family protein n=1 Tax=Nocardioides marmotae TaxID=2663857 RepID=UPI0012B5BC85|nr:SidA/IucD/PvdA family monooxygenase [Nocardioides marmotae]MBC9735050.1 SidA/IucD/PvdA family monooxygenase [Nocardioides marmotae]MTB86150.1 SidA/IucD/PvdA family monooxygenase [Nocardioides marmotae]
MSAPDDYTHEGRVHDVVGIGLGPFNLGLACLADPVEDLDCVFLEARDHLAWHPGMLLDDATLQVPFLADLVTMADPTSRWSFLSYLKESGNLYPFYIRESFYPLRREYDDYCRWAAERLGSVRFGQAVTSVEHDGETYVVTTARGETFRGRAVVLGTGTQPRVLPCVRDAGGPAIHTADYLAHKRALQALPRITIVGSGQSAAEVYHDLLTESPDHDYELVWLTRSPRFFPMEYTKLTLEMTSPEYTSYFQGLPGETRERLLREQRSLYKGISGDLVDAISDLHYRLRVQGAGPRTTLLTNTTVVDAAWDGTAYTLGLHHDETGEDYAVRTEGLVLATGYAAQVPEFLDPVRDRLNLDDQGRYVASATYAVDRAGTEVFVQNAEEHTHGFVAPDLGMGAFRNSVIIAALTGREAYPVEKRIAVQSFGVPDHLRVAP